MVMPLSPEMVSEPVPEIAKGSVTVLLVWTKFSQPLFVIAPVMLVTGLVINEVVPLPMVPPLVTVLVLVTWACTLAAPKERKASKQAIRL